MNEKNNFFRRGAFLFSPLTGGAVEPLDAAELAALKRLKLAKLLTVSVVSLSAVWLLVVVGTGIANPSWRVKAKELQELDAQKIQMDGVVGLYQKQRKQVAGIIHLAPWITAISTRVGDKQLIEEASGALEKGIFKFTVEARFADGDDKADLYVQAVNARLGALGTLGEVSMRRERGNVLSKIHTFSGLFKADQKGASNE